MILACQATEQAEINRKILVQENETKIEVIEKKKLNKPKKYSSTRWAMEKQQQQSQLPIKQEGGENLRKTPRENGNVSAHKYKFNCTKCGKTHSINECPAYKKSCNICGYKNHFAIMCRNKIKSENKQLNTIVEENKVSEYLCLDKIEVDDTCNTWTDIVKINGTNVEIKLDTGAQLNVMPVELYKKINVNKLDKSEVIIKTFAGFTVKSQGKISVELENKQCKGNIRFEVVEYKGMPILGLKDYKSLKYKLNEMSEIQLDNKKEKFIKENIDIFSGIGKFPDKIKIKV